MPHSTSGEVGGLSSHQGGIETRMGYSNKEVGMTVEILDDKPDPSVLKQVICRNCGRKLQYVPHDVECSTCKDYIGDSDTSYWILCPGCNMEVRVSAC